MSTLSLPTTIVEDVTPNHDNHHQDFHTVLNAISSSGYKIATSTSFQRDKDSADEVLDGVDDHTQINTALTSYEDVWLAPGAYDIGAPIEMPSRRTLHGVGMSTILRANGITTGTDVAMIVSKANAAVFLRIANLALDGNYSSGGSACHGIYLRNTSIEAVEPQPGGSDNWSILDNLWLEGFRVSTNTVRKGIWLASANGTQRSNILQNLRGKDFGAAAVHIDGSSDNTLTQLHFGNSNGYGLWLAGANNMVDTSKFYFTKNHAFYIPSRSNQLTNVQAQDMNGGDGYRVEGEGTILVGAHAGAELGGQATVSGLHLAADDCYITGYVARVAAGTMTQGINFASGNDNTVYGKITDVAGAFGTAQVSGTPAATNDIRVTRKGTTIYTG